MGESDYSLSFNRGVVDKTAFARADIERVALSAETQQNFLPRTMGPMSLRPGWKFLASTQSDNAARLIPFVFALGDTAKIELTDLKMRVWVNDTVITRASVSSAVTNGTFDSDLTGWSDEDEGTAVSAWVTGGYLGLLGDNTLPASRKQTVTVAGGDQNVEHALDIVVTRGVVQLRVGSTDGDDDYIAESSLNVGSHSLAFTPTGASVFIEVSNRDDYQALLDSCVVASSGDMVLTSPVPAASFNDVRHAQSGDVVFLANGLSVRPLRIERRATNSWSIVDYVISNGPYRGANTSPITIAPSALNGTITLTASKPAFRSTSVGAIYAVTSTGQTVVSSLSAQNTFTNPVRVSGITTGRPFLVEITGTWTATVTLQRSVGAIGAWTDVSTYTTNQTPLSVDDEFDNQIIYYRLGIKTGDYSSGTAVASIVYSGGSITGHARVVGYTSSTVVDAVVLTDFGSTTANDNWREGRWSARRGYPSGNSFFGARLWWAGGDRTIGSVVDDFANHDLDYIGDAGPIDRSIGSGPVDKIQWLVALQQLVAGGEGAEFLCRSSSLEEPLTPTNYNLRESTTYGSANVGAIKIDASAIFVDRTGTRIMETVTDAATMETGELTVLSHDICKPGIVRMAVQRRPETTIHLVRSDGTVVLLVFDRAEQVKCFTTVVTDGLVEDVCVLPGTVEDSVYYVVNRTINAVTKRYVEKWALQSETIGGATDNKMLDSYLIYSGVATTTITGLGHLEGEAVYVWANGLDEGPFTVTSGQITGLTSTTDAIVGLQYTGLFISTKVGYSTIGVGAMTASRRITHLGFILSDTHNRALTYGVDQTHLNPLPKMRNGKAVTANEVFSYYDEDAAAINGTYDVDSRLVLKAVSPLPCTVNSVTVFLEDGRTKGDNKN